MSDSARADFENVQRDMSKFSSLNFEKTQVLVVCLHYVKIRMQLALEWSWQQREQLGSISDQFFMHLTLKVHKEQDSPTKSLVWGTLLQEMSWMQFLFQRKLKVSLVLAEQ